MSEIFEVGLIIFGRISELEELGWFLCDSSIIRLSTGRSTLVIGLSSDWQGRASLNLVES